MNFKDMPRLSPDVRMRRKFPESDDARCRNGMLFPDFQPKFSAVFNKDTTVFAIGSCFARNIEEALEPSGVRLPTYALKANPSEKKGRARGLINEFTPGCIQQRIFSALGGGPLSEQTIVPQGAEFVDLLLAAIPSVTWERAIERRREIDAIYRELAQADLVVVTLGYVESWYDQETSLYLNRRPPRIPGAPQSKRYVFKRLDVEECMSLLQPAFDAMTQKGLKIVLTVSPVPLGMTFSGDDCVIANEFSKSVLRNCADRLARHPNVEYFPSYEIVRSAGLSAYVDDNRHVRPDIVEQVTRYMMDAYAASGSTAGKDEARAAATAAAVTQRYVDV
jgi:hypothetical protein